MNKQKILTWVAISAVAIPAVSGISSQIQKSNGLSERLLLGGEKKVFDTSETPNVYSTDAPAMLKAKGSSVAPTKAPEGSIWFEGFESEDQFNRFKIVNGNNDKYQWEYVSFYKAPRVSTGDVKGDDWMISPAIELEGGKSYRFTIDARPGSGSSSYLLDTFEVMAGQGDDPSDLTIEVIPESQTQFLGYDPTAIGSAPYFTTYTGYLKTSEAGNYYIGVHGISEPGAYTFYVKDMTLYAGVEAAAPGKVTDLMAVPEKDGGLSVDISFRTPKIDAKDQNLASLNGVKIFRGEDLVHTFDNPAVNTMLSFTDTPDSVGTYVYKVIPFNDEGEGMSNEVEVFVGVGYAAAPESVNAVETTKDGEVTVSWDAVTTSEEGGYINADKVRYFIGVIMPSGELETVADDIEGTSYTYQAVEEGDQLLLQYAVASKTDQGYSVASLSNPVTVGTPADVPWVESFPNATLSTVMGTQALNGQCQWSISRDESFQNMKSADDDNGYVSFWTSAPGDVGRLYTGKFLLKDLKNPAITFYIYKRSSGTPDIGTIEVELNAGNGYETISTVTAEPYPLTGWNKVVVPVPAEYIGKVVNVGFKATRVTYTYQFLDQLRIEDLNDYNLMISSVSGPAEIEPGQEFRIEGIVTNTGALDAEGYKFVLKSNGRQIAEKYGQTIETGSQAKVVFKVKDNVVAGDYPVYTLSVEWAQDQNESDNSKDLIVRQRLHSYPVPEEVAAVGSPDSITISWQAPEFDPTEVPEDVFDDFEDYESFSNFEIGDWLLYDGDKGKIGGFNLPNGAPIVMPGISMNSQQSWWVMDNTAEDLKDLNTFYAKSGTKFLSQQYVTGGVVCDDWLISPEVYSGGQTVTFYARSFYPTEPETFEVLYSTGSTDPADFEKLMEEDETPGDWTKYEVALPEGARRFAIRCTSDYRAMMFIDDISYIPAENYGLELEGYNVYRDGKLLNEEPVAETSFVDKDVTPDSRYTYHVSAVYGYGESKAAGPATAEASGIGFIPSSEALVFAEDCAICIVNAAGKHVSVYSASGLCLYDVLAGEKETVKVEPGVYVVRIDKMICKLVVK